MWKNPLLRVALALGVVGTTTNVNADEAKSVAPIAMKTSWLGYTMEPRFDHPTKMRAITGPVVVQNVNEFNSTTSELRSDVAVSAALKGYGIELAGAVSGQKHVSLFRVYKISRIEEIDMRRATIAKTARGFVPTRIYYGWALYVLAEGDASSFSVEASAQIFRVDAKVKVQASMWRATTHIALRGLDSRIANEVIVPHDIADITNKFVVATENPQPILVDYKAVGTPDAKTIAWPAFTPPDWINFDAASRYRIYRDPRVAPGQLHVVVANTWPHDHAVFELWQQGAGSHACQWLANKGETKEQTIATPTWPLKLVWVNHHDGLPNVPPDLETGWTLEWWRYQ
jgi:hypothetical protein